MNIYVMIIIMALVNFFTRLIPFLLFKDNNIPLWLIRLGENLPPAMMVLLVLYCIKDINLLEYSYGIAELFSILIVILLHTWKHNTLLSILSGTALYMFLVQIVF